MTPVVTACAAVPCSLCSHAAQAWAGDVVLAVVQVSGNGVHLSLCGDHARNLLGEARVQAALRQSSQTVQEQRSA